MAISALSAGLARSVLHHSQGKKFGDPLRQSADALYRFSENLIRLSHSFGVKRR